MPFLTQNNSPVLNEKSYPVADPKEADHTGYQANSFLTNLSIQTKTYASSTALTRQPSFQNIIKRAFLGGQSKWIEEPVISQWSNSRPHILAALEETEELYKEFRTNPLGAFHPFSDPLWLETGAYLQKAGLPWHNNNLNLPEEVDHSWPFNFKVLERKAVLLKGARVGDPNASGYICNWMEANQYGIRALQQELRAQKPDQKPLLVAANIERDIVESASQTFGLDLVVVDLQNIKLCKSILFNRSDGWKRPLIFAATLGNSFGQIDDIVAINDICSECSMLLHVDASRTFDYLTTLLPTTRKRLGLPQLRLEHIYLGSSITDDGSGERTLLASSIVAAGMNSIYPPPVVVLKPRSLGSLSPSLVEYVRGTDSTLAGSRDAMGPLLVALQELRFGASGMRDIYARCAVNRQILCDLLMKQDVSEALRVEIPRESLDLIIHVNENLVEKFSPSFQGKWGFVKVGNGKYLMTMQPSVKPRHLEELVRQFTALCGKTKTNFEIDCRAVMTVKPEIYRLPQQIVQSIDRLVSSWRVVAKSSGGYPLNQAPYSALGPIIGHFIPISIPSSWADARAKEILKDRKRQFGLADGDAECDDFIGIFTTGSTMGNRVGIHTALAHCDSRNTFVYYSSATHYSVKKIVRDCDALTRIWEQNERPRFAEIQADEYGMMRIGDLVEQVLQDRSSCGDYYGEYKIILLANMGTTFVGGRDNILGLRKALHAIDAEIAYIHVDGALDLGFTPDLVCLGRPGSATWEKNGLPIVQGITLSHHKAFGIMVSGEVISYSPNPENQSLAKAVELIDPRVIFETWLFQKLYRPADLLKTNQYCLDNANLLRRLLSAIQVRTRFNEKSFITLMERLPPWTIQNFHLAPEGNWVHYIAMPHISPLAIHHFVNEIATLDMMFENTFNYVSHSLSIALALDEPLTLRRVHCHDQILLPKVLDLARKELFRSSVHTNGNVDGWSDSFKRRFLYGAMSFVAMDEDCTPKILFLSEVTTQKLLCPGPVVSVEMMKGKLDILRSIADEAFIRLSALLGLRVVETLVGDSD